MFMRRYLCRKRGMQGRKELRGGGKKEGRKEGRGEKGRRGERERSCFVFLSSMPSFPLTVFLPRMSCTQMHTYTYTVHLIRHIL